MKIPGELWGLVALIVVPLTTVQVLHIWKHNTYCKTESEWKSTLPMEIQDLLRD